MGVNRKGNKRARVVIEETETSEPSDLIENVDKDTGEENTTDDKMEIKEEIETLNDDDPSDYVSDAAAEVKSEEDDVEVKLEPLEEEFASDISEDSDVQLDDSDDEMTTQNSGKQKVNHQRRTSGVSSSESDTASGDESDDDDDDEEEEKDEGEVEEEEEEEEEEDEQKGDLEDTKSGLANVMAKILAARGNADSMLSKAKKDTERIKEEEVGDFEFVDADGNIKKEVKLEVVDEEDVKERALRKQREESSNATLYEEEIVEDNHIVDDQQSLQHRHRLQDLPQDLLELNQDSKNIPTQTSTQSAGTKGKRQFVYIPKHREKELVEWYQQNELLYNRKLSAYREKDRKEAVYRKKASELQISVMKLQKWLEGMRTRYAKLIAEKSGQGCRKLTEREAWIKESFSFLRPHIVRCHSRRTKKYEDVQPPVGSEDNSTTKCDIPRDCIPPLGNNIEVEHIGESSAIVERKLLEKREEIVKKLKLKPDREADHEKEKQLRIIATQGVVQLFSAIEKHRTAVRKERSEIKSVVAREEMSSQAIQESFLDILNKEGEKINKAKKGKKIKRELKEEPIDLPASAKKPKWSVLSDNFYKEPKLQGWDTKSDDEE